MAHNICLRRFRRRRQRLAETCVWAAAVFHRFSPIIADLRRFSPIIADYRRFLPIIASEFRRSAIFGEDFWHKNFSGPWRTSQMLITQDEQFRSHSLSSTSHPEFLSTCSMSMDAPWCALGMQICAILDAHQNCHKTWTPLLAICSWPLVFTLCCVC